MQRTDSPARPLAAALALALLGILALTSTPSCARTPQSRSSLTPRPEALQAVVLEPIAEARLYPVSGEAPTVALVHFRDQDDGTMRLDLDVYRGPHGVHGVQILARRDCDLAPGAELAHFSPAGGEHGLRTSDERHVGDLGNVVIDAAGYGELEAEVPSLSMDKEDFANIAGRALVLRAGRDFGSEEQGGPVIACGIITARLAPASGPPEKHWLAP